MAETPDAKAAPHSPGALLAAERERQGLSRADLAQRLHMSVSQIEALEVGDYSRLPRGTFLRGFTRNYARALGLDADALVGLLAEDAPRENSPGIVVPSQNIRFDPLGQRLANPYVKAAGIALALLILGFAGMYWWLFIRPQTVMQVTVHKSVDTVPSTSADGSPAGVPAASGTPDAAAAAAPATPEAAPAASASGPSTTAPAMPAPATPAAPAPAKPSPAPAAAAGTTPPASAPATSAAKPAEATAPGEPRKAAAGEGLIQLSFRAAAWVEILDARGKVILSRTHPGGSSTEVAGKPPFNLVIGNAPEVRLTYNGREIDLAPYTRVAVARFTLP